VASFRARVRARASRATSSVPRAPSSTFIAVHTRARAFDRASDDVRTSARGPSHHIRVVRSRRRRRTGGVRARADRGHAHGRERGGLLRPSQERRSRRHRAKFVRRRVRTTRATTRRTIARVGASRVCVFITQMKTSHAGLNGRRMRHRSVVAKSDRPTDRAPKDDAHRTTRTAKLRHRDDDDDDGDAGGISTRAGDGDREDAASTRRDARVDRSRCRPRAARRSRARRTRFDAPRGRSRARARRRARARTRTRR